MSEKCVPVGYKLTMYHIDSDTKLYSELYDYQSQAIERAKGITLIWPHMRGVVSRVYPDSAY